MSTAAVLTQNRYPEREYSMNKEIAKKFLTLRKQNGFSQEELAERLGVSRQAVSKWERAEASPDTDNLISLAKIYNISLDSLLGISSENENRRSVINLKKDNSIEADKIREKYPEYTHDGKIGDNIQYTENENRRSVINIKKDNGIEEDEIREKYPENSYNGKTSVNIQHTENDRRHYYNYETQNDEQTAGINKVGISAMLEHIQNDKAYYKSLMKLPYPLFVTAFFLTTGAFFDLWHPMWMLFMTIPLYYTTIMSIHHKDANIFCFPVVVTLVYLIIGFITELWHPTWLMFISIPFYYWAINITFKDKTK